MSQVARHAPIATIFFFALVFSCTLAIENVARSQTADAVRPIDPRRETFYNVLGNYGNYYAEYEPLCFKAIIPGTPDDYRLRLIFGSNMPGFKCVECAEDADQFQTLKDDTLVIPFDAQGDAAQEKTYKIRPVFATAEKTGVYTIRVNCMTRKAFQKSGGQRDKDIVKIFCQPRISFGSARPENWKTFKVSEADIAFAQKQWGHLLQGGISDYEKAQILTKTLIRELAGHGGLPSAFLYKLPTFEKYEAIRSGKSKFACAQYSEIFSKACNCFGVINRWGFLNDNLQNDDVLVELGSSHLVTEIFDRQRNQWIFIDGSMNTLGAYLGDIGPLTLHEFLLFMNQPYRRGSLNVVFYDPGKDEQQIMPVDKCPKEFLSYRGWTKGFHTQYRDAP
jgi:hypothetical protein